MINTLIWRIKEAWQVILGRKKTIQQKNSPYLTPKNIHKLDPFSLQNKEQKKLLDSTSIEFLFSEFGEERTNGGGNTFDMSRLDPSISTLKKYFPNAKYTVYTDFDIPNIEGVQIKKVISPVLDKTHPRYLYRTADYFKFKSLIDSNADFKCIIDSDMYIFSENVYHLINLTKHFGFCAPQNPRNIMQKDMRMSKDTQTINDIANGLGHSYNQSPMTLWKDDERGNLFFNKCCEIMAKDPSRASLVMWKAALETKSSPYLLPSEWCVCAEDIGIEDEIILHVGHPEVAKYYNIKTT